MDKVGSAKGSAAVCQPVKLPFVIKISQGQGDGIAGVGPKIRCIDSLVTPAWGGGAYGPQHQGQKNPLSKAAFRTLADHGTLQNDQCPHDAVTAAPLGCTSGCVRCLSAHKGPCYHQRLTSQAWVLCTVGD